LNDEYRSFGPYYNLEGMIIFLPHRNKEKFEKVRDAKGVEL